MFLLDSYSCGTLPAECLFWTGVRRGIGLPSRKSRGRRNSYFSWTVLKWDLVFICESTWNIWFNSAGIFSDMFWLIYQLLFTFSHSGPNWVATLNAGKGGAHASYYHRANKQVQQTLPYCINTTCTFVEYCKNASVHFSPDPSWSGVWSQYQNAGDHNLFWIPDGTTRSQYGVSR